jgi:hypothetical protein
MPAAIVTGDANGNTGESRLRPGGGRGVGDSRTDAGAWKSIALGIVLAGGVYPLVLVAIWTVVFGIIVVRLWLIDPAHMSTLEDLITQTEQFAICLGKTKGI